MIGNARVAHGAEKNRVKRPQLLKPVVRHHFAGLHVSFTAPVEFVPLPPEAKALPRSFEHANAFGHHFFANAVSGDHRNVKSLHFSIYPAADDNSGDNADMSEADSSVLTKAIIFSVLACGHSANSAHPRNFSEASSKLIGFAGLPLPNAACPVITLPFFRVIFRMEVILSKPALSAWGST